MKLARAIDQRKLQSERQVRESADTNQLNLLR